MDEFRHSHLNARKKPPDNVALHASIPRLLQAFFKYTHSALGFHTTFSSYNFIESAKD